MPRELKQDMIFTTVSRGDTRRTVREIDNVSGAVDHMGDQSDSAARDVDDLEGGLFNLGSAASVAGGFLAGMAIEKAFSAVGGAVQDVLAINGAMNKFEAQTDIAGTALDKFEGIAGRVFTRGYGEDFGDVVATMSQIHRVTGETGDELERATEKAFIFSETFDKDVSETIRSADTVAEQFGITTSQAMDLLFAGIQRTGDPADDLLDTFNEYSANFNALELDAADMLSILNTGLEAGARNTDDIADGMREFGIRLKDGSSDLALWQLGLDGVKREFERGEISGEEFFNTVITALNDTEDATTRNRLGVELFGTKWEDAGEDVFLALETANEGMEQFEGATDAAGDALARGPQQAFDRFMRTLKLGLAQVLGPIIDRGFNLLADVLDGLPGLFNKVSGAVDSVISPLSTLIAVAQQFGLQSGQFFGFLTKFFGPETAADIKRVTDALAEMDFSRLADELFNNLLSGAGRLGEIINDQIVQPVISTINNIDWAEVAGIVGKLAVQLFEGSVDFNRWVFVKVFSKIKAALSNEARIQEIFENAGEISAEILRGLGEGLGSVASWATINVIDALANALSGGGGGAEGGRGGGKVFDSSTGIGQSILNGISSVFGTAANTNDFVNRNIIAPFVLGLTGVDLVAVADEGKRIAGEILVGIASVLADINANIDWLKENVIQPLVDAIPDAATLLEESAKGLGVSIIEGMLKGLEGLGDELLNFIKEEIDRIDDIEIVPGVSVGNLISIAVPGLAAGGDVEQGKPVIVGERGPELFVPAVAGAVISNRDTTAMLDRGSTSGGAMSVSQSFAGANFNLPGVTNARQFMQEMEQIANRQNKTIFTPLRGSS